ncbi:MAG: DUF4198 domain-containing protein [Bacteroidota bacterium]|nr:DUF4198 domain-containing protein [Candidatus Kapabacteria bacterium]MDW8219532.1 DUF4198 domain-containing protein [Bacteroidota bacterium]
MWRRTILLFIHVYALPLGASAHDTWLLPMKFRVKPEERVTLSLTSGMAFPANEYAIQPERVARASMTLSDEKTILSQYVQTQRSLELSVMPPHVGVATISIEIYPRTITLQPNSVRAYLKEIGGPDSLQAVWRNVTASDITKRWRERYTKYAKTFLFVGVESLYCRDSSWKTPCGMMLEILPETHPGKLRAGMVLPVRVVFQGQPLVHFPIGCLNEGERHGRLVRTDAEGRAQFCLRRAGRYLLRGTLLQKAQSSDIDWESYFTTLTVQVRR